MDPPIFILVGVVSGMLCVWAAVACWRGIARIKDSDNMSQRAKRFGVFVCEVLTIVFVAVGLLCLGCGASMIR